jgi:hypothetical protein
VSLFAELRRAVEPVLWRWVHRKLRQYPLMPPNPGGLTLTFRQEIRDMALVFEADVLFAPLPDDPAALADIDTMTVSVEVNGAHKSSHPGLDRNLTVYTVGDFAHGDLVRVYHHYIDAAGNASPNPAVVEAQVSDITPPTNPGELSLSFRQVYRDDPAPEPEPEPE